MNIFLSYILLGFSLAAPIGPVNAAQLEKGIKHGFWHAWLVGLGAMAADAIFMLLIYFGLAHFLETPFARTFLWLFGGFILIYTGVESFRNNNELSVADKRSAESHAKSFYSGFLMTFTNPVSILFWLGIYGSILATTAQRYGALELLLYRLGHFYRAAAVGYSDGVNCQHLSEISSCGCPCADLACGGNMPAVLWRLFRMAGDQGTIFLIGPISCA